MVQMPAYLEPHFSKWGCNSNKLFTATRLSLLPTQAEHLSTLRFFSRHRSSLILMLSLLPTQAEHVKSLQFFSCDRSSLILTLSLHLNTLRFFSHRRSSLILTYEPYLYSPYSRCCFCACSCPVNILARCGSLCCYCHRSSLMRNRTRWTPVTLPWSWPLI